MGAFLVWNTVWQGAVAALTGLAFTVLYRTVRFLDFGFAAAALWGAYLAQWLVAAQGINVWYSSLLTIVVVALGGVILHTILYGSASEDNALALPNLLSSLGAYLLLQNGLLLWLGPKNMSFFASSEMRAWRASGQGRDTLMVIAVLILLIASATLKYTGIGLRMHAVGSSYSLARVRGMNVRVLSACATALAYSLVSATAILVAIDTNLQPNMGFRSLMTGVVSCIVGGVTSVRGAVTAGFLLGAATQAIAWYLGPQWTEMFLLTLFVLALLLRPTGILAAATEAKGLSV
ncbi:MAG TPA: branched-chain amino acid ABC transporter permease [Thermoanaerobaculia bacterium]|jgi:branched-subunit amino acid ABC-type transport system permease component